MEGEIFKLSIRTFIKPLLYSDKPHSLVIFLMKMFRFRVCGGGKRDRKHLSLHFE